VRLVAGGAGIWEFVWLHFFFLVELIRVGEFGASGRCDCGLFLQREVELRRHFGLAALLVVLMVAPAWGFTIVSCEYSLNYGSSWDNPSENISAVLGTLTGETQLMLVNGYNSTGGPAAWSHGLVLGP